MVSLTRLPEVPKQFPPFCFGLGFVSSAIDFDVFSARTAYAGWLEGFFTR